MKKIVAFAMLCCLMLTMCTFVVAEPEGHNWDAGTWVDTPTCQHPGQIEYKCLNEGCNATKEVKVREVECSYRAATCEVAERCRWCNEKNWEAKNWDMIFRQWLAWNKSAGALIAVRQLRAPENIVIQRQLAK